MTKVCSFVCFSFRVHSRRSVRDGTVNDAYLVSVTYGPKQANAS